MPRNILAAWPLRTSSDGLRTGAEVVCRLNVRLIDALSAAAPLLPPGTTAVYVHLASEQVDRDSSTRTFTFIAKAKP